jgi:coproporphyrinogen III oxidase-like Fe-S oxidoreductase
VRDWDRYAALLSEGESPVEGDEILDAADAALERAWLGLRTDRGVAAETDAEVALARRWHELGWAEVTDGVIRLTPNGWLLLDRLAVELDAAHDRGADESAAAALADMCG